MGYDRLRTSHSGEQHSPLKSYLSGKKPTKNRTKNAKAGVNQNAWSQDGWEELPVCSVQVMEKTRPKGVAEVVLNQRGSEEICLGPATDRLGETGCERREGLKLQKRPRKRL